MIKENSKKTSVNVPIGLADAYGGNSTNIKKVVLDINPASLTLSALLILFKEFGIKRTSNPWMNTSHMDELLTILFPSPDDRSKTKNVKLHLREDEKNIILKLSGEDKFTTAFRKHLTLHYAMQQQSNMEQVRKNATEYYNRHILRLPEDSIHTRSCYDIKTPHKTIITSDTGLKVHGNKKWFLNNLGEI